ncbi:MAG: glycosyltransferase family 2 protein [Verrucomicrobiae bacterium]|nr:glycosyltransferase family 2 protein [Verrucomicrobiae bacterium]
MKISVVIPAKDEAATIQEVIAGCRPFADEILVVDGRSRDDTAALAQKAGAKVIADSGHGKGAAIRESIQHVQGEIVVFIDADCSHDPADIPKLIAPIREGNADHVSGSRLLGGSSELHGTFAEFMRLAGSAFITWCINARFGVQLSESQNGFRAIRTDVFKKLDLRENITTIEQEMIMETLRKGFRMGEVPTHEHKRKAGDSHIKLTRVWFRYGWCLVKKLWF